VLAGLADEADEIKVLCHMMLFRLSQVAPTALAQRLDEATPELEKTMRGAAVTKDTVNRISSELQSFSAAHLEPLQLLARINSPGVAPKFEACVESIRKSPTWGVEFKDLVGHA